MDYKVYKLTVDLKQGNYYSIQPKQGETGVKLIITLVADSVGYNVAGTIVNAIFRKPDDTVSYLPCTIEDGAKGIVSVALTNQVLALPGRVNCELQVTGDKGLVKSWTFCLLVQETVGTAEIESSNEFVALEAALETVNQYDNRIANLEAKDIEIEKKISEAQYSAPQEVTASVITLPDSVAEGQFSDIVMKGRSLKQELNYNRDTWSEWIGITGTTVQNGLLVIENNASWLYPRLTAKFKPNTKYGILLYVKTNTRVASTDVFTGASDYPFAQADRISLTQGQTGFFKKVATTQGNIINNQYYSGFAPDTGKIEFGDIRIFELPVGSEIESDFNTMAADQLAVKYPYIKGGGVVSTESVRIRSCGENLFDFKQNYISLISGTVRTILDNGIKVGNSVAATYRYVKYRIKLPPLTTMYLSRTIQVISGSDANVGRILVYDSNGTVIRTILKTDAGGSFTTDSTGIVEISFYSAYSTSEVAEVNFTNIMLNEGNSALPYESYKSGGEAYIDGELRSVGGVFDEVNVITGVKTQRVSDEIVLDGSKNWTAVTDLGTVYRAAINPHNLSNIALNSSNMATSTRLILNNQEWRMEINYTGDTEHYYVSHLAINLFIAKSKIDAMTGATALDKWKAYLNQYPATLTYQLATPVVHEGKAQPLTAFSNGHIIIEPVVKEVSVYNAGITIKHTNLPIKSLESVYKINPDNSKTPIDISTCTVASDGKSFTSMALANDDIVEYTYLYDNSLTTLPTVRYSYPLNVAASLAENTKAVTAVSKSLTDFMSYQNAVNLQFDLRLTALEP